MASPSEKLLNVRSSLTFRVLLLLTLTIAPIGAIAVFQTSRLAETLDARAVDSLLAATLKSVTPERIALERAMGAADALSHAVPLQTTSDSACHALFSKVITGEDGYAFSGIATRDGVICAGPELGASLNEIVAGRLTFQTAKPVIMTAETTGSGKAIIAQPVWSNGAVAHYTLLSVAPRFTPDGVSVRVAQPDAIALVTQSGDLVRASSPLGDIAVSLPSTWSASQVAGDAPSRAFSLPAIDGEERTYAAVPLLGRDVYALAIWPKGAITLSGSGVWLAPWTFPILMWLATLVISYIAINRVVVRHVRHLGMHMRRFARNKMVPPEDMIARQPVEFSEINTNFRAMATAIVQDEAELENAVHEKTLLLREVHHRVKNNLQLIASIMNMQIRRSESRETTVLLRRLQDRVLGLAAIHRQMYKAQALDRVPAHEVLESILDQVVRFDPSDPVTVSHDLAEMPLVQDQAVPLALLTAEAATNAMGYLGTNAVGAREMHVALERAGQRGVRLTVRNTVSEGGGVEATDFETSQAGLGTQLINAFARQLEGEVEKRTENGFYELILTFDRVAWDKGDDGPEQDEIPVPDEESGEGAEPGFPLASAASAST